MTIDQFLALAGLLSAPVLSLVGLTWRQNVKLAVIEARSKELEHNGGGSMKDMIRDARDLAAEANERSKVNETQTAKIQRDLTRVRVGVEYASRRIDQSDQDRAVKEQLWIAALEKQGITTPKENV